MIVLASSGHRFADVDLDDPSFERTPYEPFVAYGRAKTANVLFAVLSMSGTGRAACAQPRFILAGFARNSVVTWTKAR